MAKQRTITSKIKDITDFRFGKLLVTNLVKIESHKSLWLCRCDCGKEKILCKSNLLSGNTKSCGCGKFRLKGQENRKHGASRTPEYRAWRNMKTRCYNKENENFVYYGARGITVCSKWLNSFSKFLRDLGPRPSSQHSLDRKNTNGNYTPENCRWATRSEQMKNRRPFRSLSSYSDKELQIEIKRRERLKSQISSL